MSEQIELEPERRAPVPESEPYEQFLKALEQASSLRRSEAERSAAAVLCRLVLTLQPQTAHEVEGEVPEALLDLLLGCQPHDEPWPQHIDRRDFVWRVSEELGLSGGEAERRIRAVFQTVRARLTDEEIEQVERQLSEDLRPLWRPAM